jgi:spore coat polysaccharide biosynthesis protein SpsF
MKTCVIVQARRGSSRLPDKVLMPVAGKPLLHVMLDRVLAASSARTVVVATTTDPVDDAIVDLCSEIRVAAFRGHATDLLDRHLQAARVHHADLVVKIPSDCPLIDPEIIDRIISYGESHSGEFDYVSNLHPATYPDGNDVEVMTMKALETAWTEATRPLEREHTTPFLWEHPERFAIANLAWETGRDYSMTHRWTIDYVEDYNFIRAVYEELSPDGKTLFSLNDILGLLERRPDIHTMNSRYAGVNWYRNHLTELRTVSPDSTRREPIPTHPNQ